MPHLDERHTVTIDRAGIGRERTLLIQEGPLRGSRRVLAWQVAVTRPVVAPVMGASTVFMTTWVWLIRLLVRHIA
ncbi:hypothetical protein ACIA98_13740 [Streptomyces sp. NPDC051366]|uniref:hypothetical protein n=1 Tax=Streptomyces sp. NPDC051366 TaxID=3365652 RepID=UPI00378B6EA3